jgi:hypothetical protein
MKTRTKLLIGAAVAVGLAGAVPAAVYGTGNEPTTVPMRATWNYHPQSVKDARNTAQSIVLAQVVSTRQGDDLVVPAAGEPSGVNRVPTQRVTVKVLQSYKGTAQTNQQLTLFQTGGVVTNSRGESGRLVLDGDPLYKAGERYLLMLSAGPDGALRTIAPEGRYRYAADGSLTPMVTSKVTDEVKAKGLTGLAPLLRSTS